MRDPSVQRMTYQFGHGRVSSTTGRSTVLAQGANHRRKVSNHPFRKFSRVKTLETSRSGILGKEIWECRDDIPGPYLLASVLPLNLELVLLHCSVSISI